jgi:hypothetical protein
VLSHDCLERALSFVLSNRLEDPTLLATQLIDIFNDVMMNNKDICRSIRLDAQVRRYYSAKLFFRVYTFVIHIILLMIYW